MGKGSSRVGDREDLEALHGKVLAPLRIEPVAAAAIRRCVARIPEELVAPPDVRRVAAELLDRLLRVAVVGIPRLVGAPREIDGALAEALGVPEIGARRVYLALSALLGRTALLERVSRQTWRIRLRDACDPTSEIHRKMLIETPREVALAEAPMGRPARIDEMEALRVEVEMLRQKLEEEQRLRVAAEEALQQARRDADEAAAGSVRSASDARSREGEAGSCASAPAARTSGGEDGAGRGSDCSMVDREGTSEVEDEVASDADAAEIAAMDQELMATLSQALITAIQEIDFGSEESARPQPMEGARIGAVPAEEVSGEGARDVRSRAVADARDTTEVAQGRLRPRGSEATGRVEVDRGAANETPDKGPSQARRFSAMLHKNKRRR